MKGNPAVSEVVPAYREVVTLSEFCACPRCLCWIDEGSGVLRCPGCGAVYEIRDGIPLLIPEYKDERYQRYRACYERIASDDLQKAKEERRDARHEDLARFIGDVRGKRVLDIGSSHALYLRELQGAVRVALDLAFPYLATIPPEAGLIRVCADAETLPIQEDFFDVVILSDILEHVLDAERVVRQVERICRPDTRVIVEVPWEEDLTAYAGEPYEFTHLRRFNAYAFSTLWSAFSIERRQAGMPYLEDPVFCQMEPLLPLSLYNFLRYIYYHRGIFVRDHAWRRRVIRELPSRRYLLRVCRPTVRRFELKLFAGSGYPTASDRVRTAVRVKRRTLGRAAAWLRQAKGTFRSTTPLAVVVPTPEAVAGESMPPVPVVTVDAYWGHHTVNSRPFVTAEESERYLEWRFEQYPLCRDFMRLYAEHSGERVLDYGCGPGDDVVGFALYSRPRKVIGIDVSEKALSLAARRLALHAGASASVSLIRTTDASPVVPLADRTVDYVNCGGVLHHTSDPQAILREFHRVLVPGGEACLMVYNRHSLWFHLYTAYIRMVIEGEFAGMEVDDAFARNTDGKECPISRAYVPNDFVAMCEQAGFRTEFVGGYVSGHELACWEKHGRDALQDARLGAEHRAFLGGLSWDGRGFPLYEGRHAGIGGVYRLHKNTRES